MFLICLLQFDTISIRKCIIVKLYSLDFEDIFSFKIEAVVYKKLIKIKRLFYDNITACCTIHKISTRVTKAALILSGFGLLVINTGLHRSVRYRISTYSYQLSSLVIVHW